MKLNTCISRTNRLFTLILALSATLLAVPDIAQAGPRDSEMPALIKKARPQVVSICAANPELSQKKDLFVLGSGVIVDARGYVLTEDHVTRGLKSVYVGLDDKHFIKGDIVFADEANDLSVIKFDPERALTEATLGPSSDLEVGEPAIVIGNPYQETFTVTKGIISRLHVPWVRKDGGREFTTYLIQTDAAINPGNSGGPLFNALGEVVGLIELKKGPAGLGWAITADRAARVLASGLSARKRAGVVHGVSALELKVLAREGQNRQAVLVKQVCDNSPASKAAIKPGDRILKVDGRALNNTFDYERAFWDRKPGDSVKLTVVREGKESTVALVLEGDGVEPEIKD